MAFVCGWLFMGVRRVCNIYGYFIGCFDEGFVGFQPRLWRLCDGWGCVRVDLWRCIGSDCGRMSGQKSRNGRSLYVVCSLVR